MENFTNQYSLSKTLRFGLTLKKSGKKNSTHQILKDLVDLSEDKIKKEVITSKRPLKFLLL